MEEALRGEEVDGVLMDLGVSNNQAGEDKGHSFVSALCQKIGIILNDCFMKQFCPYSPSSDHQTYEVHWKPKGRR